MQVDWSFRTVQCTVFNELIQSIVFIVQPTFLFFILQLSRILFDPSFSIRRNQLPLSSSKFFDSKNSSSVTTTVLTQRLIPRDLLALDRNRRIRLPDPLDRPNFEFPRRKHRNEEKSILRIARKNWLNGRVKEKTS